MVKLTWKETGRLLGYLTYSMAAIHVCDRAGGGNADDLEFGIFRHGHSQLVDGILYEPLPAGARVVVVEAAWTNKRLQK